MRDTLDIPLTYTGNAPATPSTRQQQVEERERHKVVSVAHGLKTKKTNIDIWKASGLLAFFMQNC